MAPKSDSVLGYGLGLGIAALTTRRKEGVMDTLQEGSGNRAPNVVTLQMQGCSARMTVFDLLLATSSGTFHPAVGPVIQVEVPVGLGRAHPQEVLTEFTCFFEGGGVTAAALPAVVALANFTSAEHILSGALIAKDSQLPLGYLLSVLS